MAHNSYHKRAMRERIAKSADIKPIEKHRYFMFTAYLQYCGYMQRMGLPYQKNYEKWLTIMEMN